MIYFVYPRLYKLSGAERLILRLAAYTTQAGAPVTLVTHYFDASCAPALGARVRLVQTGSRLEISRNHYLNAPFEYLSSLRLVRHIRSDAEALVMFGPPSLPALVRASFGRLRRVRRLYFCYEPPRFIYDDADAVTARMGWSGPLLRPGFGIYKWLDRLMVRRADVLLANSHFGAARLQAAYGRSATVITHGADLNAPTPAAVEAVRARHALHDKFVLLTVNFLHPRKRIDLFLRTCAALAPRVPNLAALVVGAGPEGDALKALARELRLDEMVRFTGFVPDRELGAYYAASDVYAHTCRAESFGLSVLEASTAGLPVVAVNEGGPREIIADGETGFLTAAAPDALARAIHELASDPLLRARMGTAARQRATALYSWERGARDLLDVLDTHADTAGFAASPV